MLYIYTGVTRKWDGGACSRGPQHVLAKKMALHGAARQPTVVNSGNRGEHTTLPLPIMTEEINGSKYFTGKINQIAASDDSTQSSAPK